MTCGNFSGHSNAVNNVLNNPISEFINHHVDPNHDEHTVTLFEQFKNTYKPVYAHDKEHAQGLNNFRQNVR